MLELVAAVVLGVIVSIQAVRVATNLSNTPSPVLRKTTAMLGVYVVILVGGSMIHLSSGGRHAQRSAVIGLSLSAIPAAQFILFAYVLRRTSQRRS